MASGSSDNTLLVVAVIAVIVAGLSLVVTYSGISAVQRIMFAETDTGTATVFVAPSVNIRFSHNIVDWGSGFVPLGGSAVLDTESTVTDFTGGTQVDNGFIIENTGNVPVLLDLGSDNTAAAFLASSAAPTYEYKVEQCHDGATYNCEGSPDPGLLDTTADDGVAAVCGVAVRNPDGLNPDPWTDWAPMPLDSAKDRVCGIANPNFNGMRFEPGNDEIELNIRITFDDAIDTQTHTSIIEVQASDATV